MADEDKLIIDVSLNLPSDEEAKLKKQAESAISGDGGKGAKAEIEALTQLKAARASEQAELKKSLAVNQEYLKSMADNKAATVQLRSSVMDNLKGNKDYIKTQTELKTATLEV
ncbi:MAG TPA: hypothetical protein PLX04_08970, partial [Caldisericia bacterium]|nr:hypothetical protein [Caldisericia bacterium]